MSDRRLNSHSKQPRTTGLAGVGNPLPDTDIKYNKKIVGYISAPSWLTPDSQWRICLMVIDGDNWKWITLKQTFASEPEARTFLNDHVEQVLRKNLHYEEVR